MTYNEILLTILLVVIILDILFFRPNGAGIYFERRW